MADAHSGNLDQPTADLNQQCFAGLEQSLSDMQAHQSHLAQNGWSIEAARALGRLAQGLIATAGSFGLHALSDAASTLERLLKDLSHRHPEPQDTDIEAISLALEQLAALIVSANGHKTPALPRPARASGRQVPLVFVVEDGTQHTESLSRALEDDGYRTRIFPDLQAFQKAWEDCDTERPAAVLLDMAFAEDDDAGAQTLSRLNLRREDNIPVVVVSARDDLPTRLAALRAGACRYFTKPVDGERLTSLLDALTHRQPPEPYRVLLVDDEPLLLEAQVVALRAAGMEVTTLDQPMRTLEAVDSTRPDVLVLDVYMPEISGPELATVLRERDEQLNLPILFLSAETDMNRQRMALNLGGDDFLVKPVQPAQLVAAVSARARRARQASAMRRRLNTALYEREREHLAINEHAIVSIADRGGDILYVNDRFCAVSGYDREELIGQNHRIVKSGRHDPAFYQDLWRTIASGRIWQGELCNRRQDGSLYWVESTIVPFLDDQGRPYQYVSIRTDITHVKQAELSLRRQRDMQQLIIQQASRFLSLSLFETDEAIEEALRASGEFIGADRSYLFLISDDGARMSNTHEWCAPGIDAHKDQIQNMPVDEAPWWWEQISTRGRLLIPDVDQLPADATAEQRIFKQQDIQSLLAFPLVHQGKTLGFIGYDAVRQHRAWNEAENEQLRLLADVISSALARMRAERSLIESEQGLIATLEATQDGILAVDENRQVCFANRRFREIWRIPEEELYQGQDDDRLLAHARTRVLDPETFLAEVEAIYADIRPSHDILHFEDGRIIERTCHPLIRTGKHGGMVWSFHDITASKQAEAAAELHKERLRRGQSYANIGTWEWNIVTGELFWTERIAPLFGYPEGDLETSYENFLNAIHPDDRRAVMEAVDACVERDQPYEIEHRVVWPDGTVRWLLERGAVMRDADGKPLQMLGVVQDIDDRKRAELALAESRQWLEEAQAMAHLGNWNADFTTGNLYWSDEVYRIFGHAPGSFSASIEAFHAAVHPDDLALVRDSETRSTISGLHDVIHRIVRPDGSIRHVHELGRTVTDDSGRVIRMSGTVQDITDRVQADQALSRLARRNELILATTTDGFFAADTNGYIQLCNPSFCAMLGYTEAEMLTMRISDFEANETAAEVDAHMRNIEESGGADRFDTRHRRKDGSTLEVEVSTNLVDVGDGPIFYAFVRDISARQKNQRALIQAREEAEQASRAKSEFLSSMSHELRTPMNAILGFAQLMEYDDNLSAEHVDNIQEILRAGRHLLDLINEVLDLARIESGNLDLSIEPVELFPLIEECISLITPLASRREIHITQKCPEDTVVRGDRTRLKQALLNLLSNAVKYNRHGGRVNLEIDQGRDGRWLRILVCDTGQGLTQAQIKRLFEPFNRLNAEHSGIEGTGIGLTITRRVVEMMGGTVGVQSEPGRGSTFWIELPLESISDDSQGPARDQGAIPHPHATARHADNDQQVVLYIEDNPSNIKLVAQILGRLPHVSLLTAHTPELGIELAMARQPGLILMDINMPNLDGYQVMQVFQGHPRLRDIPVIAVTANALPRDIQKGLAAGFREYLTKPLDIQQVLTTLDQHLPISGRDAPASTGGSS